MTKIDSPFFRFRIKIKIGISKKEIGILKNYQLQFF